MMIKNKKGDSLGFVGKAIIMILVLVQRSGCDDIWIKGGWFGLIQGFVFLSFEYKSGLPEGRVELASA